MDKNITIKMDKNTTTTINKDTTITDKRITDTLEIILEEYKSLCVDFLTNYKIIDSSNMKTQTRYTTQISKADNPYAYWMYNKQECRDILKSLREKNTDLSKIRCGIVYDEYGDIYCYEFALRELYNKYPQGYHSKPEDEIDIENYFN